ncbi:MAG: 3'-5' exonuclease [Candidatus Saccharibacteria bacterium]
MSDQPLVFLDIETTGASAQSSRVIEIGAVRVESGKITDTFNQLISPGTYIPSFITGLTGIDDRMLEGKPMFSDIARKLQDFLQGSIFVAHNVAFDYSFLKMEYRLLSEAFAMDRLCTVRLSRALYPEQRRHNLDTIIATHGFTVNSRHRALDDAKVLYEFYLKALSEHGENTHVAMQRILKKSTA